MVDWDWDTINTPDNQFQQVSGRSIVLADYGFRKKGGVPENCRLCPKGQWNDRMMVETSFSLATVVCGLKRMFHRLEASIQARLASMVVLFNVLLILFHQLHPDTDPGKMRIAEFSL